MIDRKHFVILKFIYHNPYVTFADLCCCFPQVSDMEAIVNELDRQHLVEFRIYGSPETDTGECHLHVEPDSHMLTLLSGNVLVEDHCSSDRRWRITTGIAIFATIGAYREELVSILQFLMRLLK